MQPVPTTADLLAVAALALFVAVRLDPHDAGIDMLATHLLAIEATAAAGGEHAHAEHAFVLGLSFLDLRVRTWQRLVREPCVGVGDLAGRPDLLRVRERLARGGAA